MAYYVYHAKPMRRARIHRGDCKHCRDGQGQENQHKTGSGATGWDGPFRTIQQAQASMRRFRYTNARNCRYCLG